MHRLVLVSLVAALMIGVLGTAATAGAPPRVEGEWVVLDLTVFETGVGDIVMMRPDGSEQTTFTSASEDIDGELSPDGTAIVFASDDGETGTAVWLMDVDGSDRRRLTEGFGQRPTWTPDGMSIVYSAFDELRAIDRDGTGDRPIAAVDADRIGESSVSPDGATVAFDATADGVSHLYTVPLAGGGATEIVSESGFEAEWSPDGSRILFTTFRPAAGGNIWAANPDGTDQENLVPSPTNDFHGTWSPDGSRVMFEAVGAEYSISMYDRVDATTQQILTTAPGDDIPRYRRPTWTAVTLDAIVVPAPTSTTSSTAPATESTSTTTVSDQPADRGSDTDWLVVGLVVAIVGLAAFGAGIVIGGRMAGPPPPPPPPPDEDDASDA